MKSRDEALKELQDVHRIQGRDGNWNHDPYMHGLYNGLELALSFFENREPAFKDAPEKWLEAIKEAA